MRRQLPRYATHRMQEITYRSARFFDEVAKHPSKHVHLILIATKPDIIK